MRVCGEEFIARDIDGWGYVYCVCTPGHDGRCNPASPMDRSRAAEAEARMHDRLVAVQERPC